jgi:hypothetical protein
MTPRNARQRSLVPLPTASAARRALRLAAAAAIPLAAVCCIAIGAPATPQEYCGAKKCGGCHFEQYMIWKKSKHAVTLETLPDKYKTDANCLKCHTTGFGTPTGYKDATTPNLAGVTCENCHGPGSEHDRICQHFKDQKTLSAEENKQARGSIERMPSKIVCLDCHTDKAHKPHPKIDKSPMVAGQ